jgi:hypothetical protein
MGGSSKDVTKAFDDAANATQKAAEDAANATKKAAEDAANATKKAAEDAARETERLAKEAADAAQKAAEDAARIAAEQAAAAQKAAEDAARETERLAKEAAEAAQKAAQAVVDYSVALVNDAEARTKTITATVSKMTEELAKAGIDTASAEFTELSKQAEQQFIAAAEAVESAALEAYAWLDENACRLGLTAAISMGCVAAFTPAQPEGAATSTTLSFMATPVLYTADMAAKMAVATAMGEVIGDAFLLIPGVGGQVDAQLLKNIISNCVYYSLDCAALWATPAGVGIAIGAAVAPVVATLVCTRTCPEGFSKALAA